MGGDVAGSRAGQVGHTDHLRRHAKAEADADAEGDADAEAEADADAATEAGSGAVPSGFWAVR